LEYRAADATASPYLQLAVLVRSGLQGIKDKLSMPEATQGDLSLLSEEELKSIGVERLPQSLDQALELFANESIIKDWYSERFVDIYLKHKKQELCDAQNIELKKLYECYSRIY
jgi:glutamine synthetase